MGTSGESWASLPPTPMAGAAPVRTGSKARVIFLYLVSYPSDFSRETPSSVLVFI